MYPFHSHTLLISCIPLLTSIVSYAQEEPGKWSLGGSMHAGPSYRTLARTANSEMADLIIDGRNDRETYQFVYGRGLQAEYRLSDRFRLGAGAGYMQFGYATTIDLGNLTFGDQIEPRRGFIYRTNDVIPSEWRLIDRFNYVEVPLYLALEFGNGRWRSSSTVGVAPAFLLAARGATISTFADGRRERERYDQPEDFETFNLIPFVSTGVSMHPGGRWHWHLRPTLRYGVLPIIDAPVTARLFSLTADVGVRFTL